MSTGKRGADKLNILGVVSVGICGAVLTYVSIVALEAYYMNDTATIERTAAHASPNSLRNRIKDAQDANIDGTREGTISIAKARDLILQEYAPQNSTMIPGKPSTKPTVEAWYGRPPVLAPPAPEPVPPVEPPATVPVPGTEQPTTTDPGGTPGTTGGPTTMPPAPPSSTAQPTPGPTTPAQPEQPATTPTTTPTTPPPAAPGGNGP